MVIFSGLESHFFHFLHFNYAVQTAEKEWPPCEVGVVKFSLLSGITDHYHEFIDPGILIILFISYALFKYHCIVCVCS